MQFARSGFQTANVGRGPTRTRGIQDSQRPSAGIRNPTSPSSRAVWLVPIEPTRLAYGKGLYGKVKPPWRCVNFGNSQSARRVVSLRGGNPCRPTQTASEALAGALGTSWRHKPMSARTSCPPSQRTRGWGGPVRWCKTRPAPTYRFCGRPPNLQQRPVRTAYHGLRPRARLSVLARREFELRLSRWLSPGIGELGKLTGVSMKENSRPQDDHSVQL